MYLPLKKKLASKVDSIILFIPFIWTGMGHNLVLASNRFILQNGPLRNITRQYFYNEDALMHQLYTDRLTIYSLFSLD